MLNKFYCNTPRPLRVSGPLLLSLKIKIFPALSRSVPISETPILILLRARIIIELSR